MIDMTRPNLPILIVLIAMLGGCGANKPCSEYEKLNERGECVIPFTTSCATGYHLVEVTPGKLQCEPDTDSCTPVEHLLHDDITTCYNLEQPGEGVIVFCDYVLPVPGFDRCNAFCFKQADHTWQAFAGIVPDPEWGDSYQAFLTERPNGQPDLLIRCTRMQLKAAPPEQ
jgi:hypothetical protein